MATSKQRTRKGKRTVKKETDFNGPASYGAAIGVEAEQDCSLKDVVTWSDADAVRAMNEEARIWYGKDYDNIVKGTAITGSDDGRCVNCICEEETAPVAQVTNQYCRSACLSFSSGYPEDINPEEDQQWVIIKQEFDGIIMIDFTESGIGPHQRDGKQVVDIGISVNEARKYAELFHKMGNFLEVIAKDIENDWEY